MKTLLSVALAALLAGPSFGFAADSPDVDTLIRELRSVRPDRRARAVESLGQIGPLAVSAVRSLISALSDPSSTVQIEALIATVQKVSAQVEMSRPAPQMVLNDR